MEKDKTTGPQDEAAASAAAADEKEGGDGGGGGGVLGSLSSVGGWFGSKKGGEETVDKPAEEQRLMSIFKQVDMSKNFYFRSLASLHLPVVDTSLIYVISVRAVTRTTSRPPSNTI